MIKVTLLFISFVSVMFASDSPQYYAYIDSVSYKLNFLNQLGIVLGVLDQYENNIYRGVKVDFGYEGEYYSRYKGSNWWEYFFKKLDLGDTTGEYRRIPNFEKVILSYSVFEQSTERVHELIQKYIEVQPEILAKVAGYQEEILNDAFVIGIYYVNSDSCVYTPPKISYKKFYDMILIYLLEKSNIKIFVYTNDKRFYSFLKVKHPDIVFQYQKVNFEINADYGEHELINCLLLSQTNLLLCTPSRFSLTVSQFNPLLPVVKLGTMAARRTE